ncbi:exodeoxyribonuclease VIII [Superficieibacter electus]|uniref:Exodeoxyribonuclease VIII n=1 Tax=Superficieibacter electus TaxID=2022662 RepID=A0A2P5GVH2_9ENTR|nr:exodeoxyribonuclease VIII [Superficieibacter electus]POP42367.1 exodeoxyribonuclease VIII [Superficieibacter electus]POP50556.1 exodeoxyribonuclease VIII [Superficieibacter electus]
MSEQQLFIVYAIPCDAIVEENGACKTTLRFYAANIRHARATAVMKFLDQYPEADDEQFQFVVYENAPGLPCGAIDVWDEEILKGYDWDSENNMPVVPETNTRLVEFDKLSPVMRIAVLVKYMTTEITSDMLPDALELSQDEANTFPGHIVEAIIKTPPIAAMYPERIIEAIKFVVEKCPTTKKWPEIKAQLANWQNSLKDADRAPVTDSAELKKGSGDPERFDLVVALLVAGAEPAKAGASDVKNAKFIKDSRDEAWRAWRNTLVGIPGIYSFPESELYALTLDGMKDLKLIKDNAARLAYVRERFAGHALLPDYPAVTDEETPRQEPQNEAATPADDQPQETPKTVTERLGPFYYRTADGGKIGRANKLPKLQEVIAAGCVEISQEEYQARKTGSYVAHVTEQDSSQGSPDSFDDVSRKLAAARGEFVEGISDPEDPKWIRTEDKQPAVKNLGGGVFSVEALTGQTAQTFTPQPATDFQGIGASLEKDLADKGDNMKIWRSVMRTDPRYTKDLAGAGFEGTSINAEYMIMRCTEIFGPIGTGWGFEVLEDRMLPGAPISEPIYDENKKFIGTRLLRDGDGTLITEQNHSIKIAFWYAGIAERIQAYGATKYLYKTKHGITCDGEAQKKSLTDAIKKALSLLGFSADVWLGLYDQAEYKQENATEFAIKNASEKAEDVTRLRIELDEKMTRVAGTIESAVTSNEAKKAYDTLAREVEVHRKAAEEKGDLEHAKYLSGRLRRLNQIKDDRIKALNGQQEQTA